MHDLLIKLQSHISFYSAEIYNFTLGNNRDNILELNHTSILKASYRDVTFKFGILIGEKKINKKVHYNFLQDLKTSPSQL